MNTETMDYQFTLRLLFLIICVLISVILFISYKVRAIIVSKNWHSKQLASLQKKYLKLKENAQKQIYGSVANSPKRISMYRKVKHFDEKNEGYDYVFMEGYDSYRQAERATGIPRYKISKSIKNFRFVKHPKLINTLVVFAPQINELNSNDKI